MSTYIEKTKKFAQDADLKFELSENANRIIVKSTAFQGTRGDCFQYVVIGTDGLEAIGEQQGNYSGGDIGRISDPNFPIRIYMLSRLPQELFKLIWEVQPEILCLPINQP